jgi:hypothetical protein
VCRPHYALLSNFLRGTTAHIFVGGDQHRLDANESTYRLPEEGSPGTYPAADVTEAHAFTRQVTGPSKLRGWGPSPTFHRKKGDVYEDINAFFAASSAVADRTTNAQVTSIALTQPRLSDHDPILLSITPRNSQEIKYRHGFVTTTGFPRYLPRGSTHTATPTSVSQGSPPLREK